MFSGIISEIGSVASYQEVGGDYKLVITADLFSQTKLGDSVAINGVCLTVAELESNNATFDVASETRRVTTLGNLGEGSKVNLELSLQVGERMHGHFVLGHVDAVAKVVSRVSEDNTEKFVFSLPKEVETFVANKGSVAINGVSLTVGEVTPDTFSVYLIPFTISETTFSELSEGTEVNIEADCLARYVQRAIDVSGAS